MTNQMDVHVSPTGEKTISKTIQINAPASQVWDVLTKPEVMKKWMSESEIEIVTDWQVGSPFVIRGKLHRIKFENKGQVLQFEPERILEYSHLSSLSRLPDTPENYSMVEFRLAPGANETGLTLTLRNFPTESIDKHLVFYWNVTLEILKRTIEGQA